MKLPSMYIQVNILKILCHLISLVGILYAPQNAWWAYSILGYFLFTRIGSDIGFHRFFTHQSFKCRRSVEIFLLALGSLDCNGSLFSWILSHHAHHKHADQIGDPHSPHRIGFYRVWLIDWELFSPAKSSIAKYVRQSVFRFTHDYYLIITLIFMIFLSLISFKFLVYFYCLPMVYSTHMTAIINTVGHSFGYKNYLLSDESRNNFMVNIFSLGGGLHNNHHAFPRKYDHSSPHRWHEIDPAAWVIKCIQTGNVHD